MRNAFRRLLRIAVACLILVGLAPSLPELLSVAGFTDVSLVETKRGFCALARKSKGEQADDTENDDQC